MEELTIPGTSRSLNLEADVSLLFPLTELPPSAHCRFAYARTLHAGFPAAFLWTERFQWALAGLVDETRPMDSMPLSLDTPAEDEIAMSALAGVSAYLPLCFMRDRHRFDSNYTFEGAPAEDFDAWHSALIWFLKKVRGGGGACFGGWVGGWWGRACLPARLNASPPDDAFECRSDTLPCPHPVQVTLRWGGCKPLLIKSPVHTARVALLLKLFPRARFVFVHRNPLATFASAGHMANTYYYYTALQRQTEEDVTEFILDQGEVLHGAYLRDRSLIPPGGLGGLGLLLCWLASWLPASVHPGPMMCGCTSLSPLHPALHLPQVAWWRCRLLSWTPTQWPPFAACTTDSLWETGKQRGRLLSSTLQACSWPASRRMHTSKRSW